MKAAAGCGSLSAIAFIVLLGNVIGCGGGGHNGAQGTEAQYETTRLCALVPARDPAAAAFPPTPPVRTFGTDLGWTYEFNGVEVRLNESDTKSINVTVIPVERTQ